MKPALLLIVSLLGGALSMGCRASEPFDAAARAALAETIIARWSRTSRVTGAMMLDKYGPPDALAVDGLGWENAGRWKKIVVRNRTEAAGAEGGAGVLEQTVEYGVPEDKRDEIEAFSGRVRVARDGRSVTARSDDEALNYLALNLADGIGRGIIDSPRAMGFYRRAVDLSKSGKSSPLMAGLLFLASP